MAVPMVALTVFTLLVPVLLQRMSLLPPWTYINKPALAFLVVSGAIGVAIGAAIPLSKTLSRSTQRGFRILQDLLAYDFYTEKLYRFTVVWLVEQMAFASNWFDRYVVDGLVNSVGLASLLGGESLKYSISGRSQGYLLTIVIGVSLLGLLMTWTMW
jgi:NAD(P)H-quinone oxidoreductase subunit 5